MTNEENLKTIGIGTKEVKKLKPKKCKVEAVEVNLIEKAKANKAIFYLAHPDKADEQIAISSTFILREKKGSKEIKSFATWVNLDEDNLLQKDSPLAILLKHYGANNVMEMVGKEVDTETDADGYLAIKSY